MADWNCNLCKEYESGLACSYCNDGSKFAKMSNADRIRSMSDEELAEFFSERDKIPNRYKCKEIEDWVKWLQYEAE